MNKIIRTISIVVLLVITLFSCDMVNMDDFNSLDSTSDVIKKIIEDTTDDVIKTIDPIEDTTDDIINKMITNSTDEEIKSFIEDSTDDKLISILKESTNPRIISILEDINNNVEVEDPVDVTSDPVIIEDPVDTTLEQQQAVRSAQNYIDLFPFSRTELIEQLIYEGFTNSEAEYGVDSCSINWDEQAVRSAQNYIDLFPFSRTELIEQLIYEGFTNSEAEYGVKAVGYSDPVIEDPIVDTTPDPVIITYTVDFNSNGGGVIQDQIIEEDGTIEEPITPTKIGYTFGGWYKDYMLWDFNNKVTSNITLTAVWNVKEYVVTFNVDGVVTFSNTNYNEKITEPTIPTKTGYTFNGWYEDGIQWDFDDVVTENVALTAVWGINSYTITFNSDGGTEILPQIITYNGSATEPTTPTKTNGIFTGWYKDGVQWDFINNKVTSNLTLTAVWSSEYTVGSEGPNGGIIFYKKTEPSDGWQYLEVTKEDLSVASASLKKSDTINTYRVKEISELWIASNWGTKSCIGGGKDNDTILRTLANPPDVVSLYGDGWYLPSIDELTEIYEVLKNTTHALNKVSSIYYLSSTIRDPLNDGESITYGGYTCGLRLIKILTSSSELTYPDGTLLLHPLNNNNTFYSKIRLVTRF